MVDRAVGRNDSAYSWLRLAIAVTLSTIGGVGMWSVVVILPALQAEFGADRGAVSLPYTLGMIGFGAGGVLMGRVADRFGIVATVLGGAAALSLGFLLGSRAGSLWQLALAHGVLIGGLGSSATFGPLIADASHWFRRHRGTAIAICASGNYLAGTVWPPVVQHLVAAHGWRTTYAGIGVFCAVTMVPLALVLRSRRAAPDETAGAGAVRRTGVLLAPGTVQGVLVLAGLACCVAMSMPQSHIVAYCTDLGYGAASGAAMLSLMFGFGIVSRIGSGRIADRIGGVPTLLLGSVLQGVALLLFLSFRGLTPLYVISALFGLFQGGIVPSYAIIVREVFPAREAGTRTGVVLMATLLGMALGGWMSGVLFDLTGSYEAAFANGLLWNLLNLSLVCFLALRRPPQPVHA